MNELQFARNLALITFILVMFAIMVSCSTFSGRYEAPKNNGFENCMAMVYSGLSKLTPADCKKWSN